MGADSGPRPLTSRPVGRVVVGWWRPQAQWLAHLVARLRPGLRRLLVGLHLRLRLHPSTPLHTPPHPSTPLHTTSHQGSGPGGWAGRGGYGPLTSWPACARACASSLASRSATDCGGPGAGWGKAVGGACVYHAVSTRPSTSHLVVARPPT
jgi:hypothetical protein